MVDSLSGDNAFTATSLYGTSPEMMYSGALSFVRRRYSRDLQGVDLTVLGIPFDTATTNRPGARFGPRALREASTNLAWERHWPWEFDPFDRLAVVDYGDCVFDHGRPQAIPDQITSGAARILDAGSALLSLGGDHFVSYPLLRAYAARHGPLALIHFDAHSDTWQDSDDRIDHGTMFFHAVKQGLIVPRHSVQIGIRTTNEQTLGLTTLDARWVHDHNPEQVAAEIRRVVGDDHPVYLTFDIDCLDPAFAPGTGTPVCGGLSSHQALQIVRGLRGVNLVGMDLVEVAPVYDVGAVTALAGATLALEFICLYAANRG